MAQAQTLVGSSRNGTISAERSKARTSQIYGTQIPAATRAIELYKVRYTSRDATNRSVVLSGLLALPDGGAPKGLVIYNHGTTADRSMSPSRFNGSNGVGEAERAVLAFVSGGYAVAAPDYLGLGDHTGPHPYPLGKVNSQSAIDLIAPALSVAAKQGVRVGPKIFVTGYSEGGAVAMWTARKLEQMPSMNTRFAASAPLSGPYDLSGATRQSLLAPNANTTEFAVRLYLMAYTVHSFYKSGGVQLSNYFKPIMANAVMRNFSENLSDEEIIQRLAFTGTLMGANNSLSQVLTPRALRALQTLDKRDPIMRELANNDVYNWTPRTRMLLVALQNDNVVAASNTHRTLQVMRARGVTSNMLRTSIIRDNNLNHITAFTPALIRARRFFDSGFANVS
jgi:dienelactone hydrolase